MELDQVKKLLTDEIYQRILSQIAKEINHPFDSMIDVPLLSVGWTRIRHSELKEADFYRLLQEYGASLVTYYVRGYTLFLESMSQTFSEWEQEEEDTTDEVEEVSTIPILALATTMIEFHYLLHNDQSGLLMFFQKEGIEDPEKFLDQCKAAFENTM